MSELIPERADVRQLRTQAKELLRLLQSGEFKADDIEPAKAKLADAQRLIARRYGFDSWPKLVESVEAPVLLARFKETLEAGDVKGLERLLKSSPSVRAKINHPLFSYKSSAIFAATHYPNPSQIMPILVRYGADPNIRTEWWAGGFGVLDAARGETANVLLGLGAKFDVWSASAHGRIDILSDLLDENPDLINAPGGDGGTPLHFAGSLEVAELLVNRGADLEQKDGDHEGTPIQHHILKPRILRLLLDRGAKPDIFTAVALDDPDLASQILAAEPGAADATVGKGAFTTTKSDGGHIYVYKIGPNTTPHALAAKLVHRKVLNPLLGSQSLARQLVTAAWLDDEASVEAILGQDHQVGTRMGDDARAITDAAQQGRVVTVQLLLKAGVDPLTQGLDSGNALHLACWFGQHEVVRLLVGRVPLEAKDASHGSPPLGWAAHGSHWCRNQSGDYVAVVETLLEAGANPNAPANAQGKTMLEQAGSREDVKDVLRRFGAK